MQEHTITQIVKKSDQKTGQYGTYYLVTFKTDRTGETLISGFDKTGNTLVQGAKLNMTITTNEKDGKTYHNAKLEGKNNSSSNEALDRIGKNVAQLSFQMELIKQKLDRLLAAIPEDKKKVDIVDRGYEYPDNDMPPPFSDDDIPNVDEIGF